MALVRNPEQDALDGSEPSDGRVPPNRLMRSVESGSPPPPRPGRRRVCWPGAIEVVFEKDPAARNIFEVLMYQGLHAIALHRVAHALYRAMAPGIEASERRRWPAS